MPAYRLRCDETSPRSSRARPRRARARRLHGDRNGELAGDLADHRVEHPTAGHRVRQGRPGRGRRPQRAAEHRRDRSAAEAGERVARGAVRRASLLRHDRRRPAARRRALDRGPRWQPDPGSGHRRGRQRAAGVERRRPHRGRPRDRAHPVALRRRRVVRHRPVDQPRGGRGRPEPRAGFAFGGPGQPPD